MSWVAQHERVKRFLKRIECTEKDIVEYEDDLINFFQNCWHLKDWIKNDKDLSSEIRRSVEGKVKLYESIQIAADLANRSKHLTLTNIRKDAKFARDVIIYAPTIGSGEEGYGRYENRIILEGDKRPLALDIAKKAVSDWEEILNEYNLID